MVGKKFGNWSVLSLDRTTSKKKYYNCLCVCGVVKSVADHSLRSGMSKSCGCKRHKTHGMFGTRFYFIYRGMLDRCSNPNNKRYRQYGDKGVVVRWESFEEFKEDMYESYLISIAEFGEKDTTIDRIDVNGDYSKDNCRWATMRTQMNNMTKNVYYLHDGRQKTLAEVCEELDLPYKTIHKRIKNGKWSFEKAIKTPVRKISKKDT